MTVGSGNEDLKLMISWDFVHIELQMSASKNLDRNDLNKNYENEMHTRIFLWAYKKYLQLHNLQVVVAAG